MIGKVLAKNIYDEDTGEIIANANEEITEKLLEVFKEKGILDFETLYINELNRGPYISDTLRLGKHRISFRQSCYLQNDASGRTTDRRGC